MFAENPLQVHSVLSDPFDEGIYIGGAPPDLGVSLGQATKLNVQAISCSDDSVDQDSRPVVLDVFFQSPIEFTVVKPRFTHFQPILPST